MWNSGNLHCGNTQLCRWLVVEQQHACVQGVFFGQLLGMADQLTFPLGRSGYRVRVYGFTLCPALGAAQSLSMQGATIPQTLA